eukprot:TRINITY_DN2838_c0_g1_i2.p2 TRINITY_DN2838_c0_g1~~TRINITY_DN2838_c0_g1_i2.p2  ORF type:complete len:264 (-),score=63.52 TRINITY_DN2838_c0_g1_i2:748-1539(-)
MAPVRALLPLLALVALLRLPSVAAQPDGFTTFFNKGSCPDGWSELGTTRGRLLVSVSQAGQGGVTVNTPMKDREDRTHAHSYTAPLELPQKNIAADDCCNGQGACSGPYTLQNDTLPGTTGLPFVQLLLCTKNGSSSSSVPFGTIGYFSPEVSACPANWKPLAEANGRVIIPGYSATGISVSSSPPLKSGEDRTHVHNLTVSVEFGDVEYIGVDGAVLSSALLFFFFFFLFFPPFLFPFFSFLCMQWWFVVGYAHFCMRMFSR